MGEFVNCSICRNYELNQLINGWIRSGVPDQEIERRLKGTPQSKTRKTIGIHHNQHLRTEVQQERLAMERELAAQQRKGDGSPPVTSKDAFVLVRDLGVEKIRTGELAFTTRDVLAAQKGLDDRERLGADRDFTLQLIQALGGALTIEGQYRDVTPGALADEAEFALLTAG